MITKINQIAQTNGNGNSYRISKKQIFGDLLVKFNRLNCKKEMGDIY